MSNDSSKFLYHTPCQHCGSSDAGSVWSDGHFYCFSCKTITKGEGEVSEETDFGVVKDRKKSFLTGEYKALSKRGILAPVCKKYGYQVGDGCHIANYYDDKRVLVAQHIRRKGKEFYWIGKPSKLQLWGQHLYSPGGRKVVITEGEIDCLSISQAFDMRWPVVSVPNGASSAAKYISQNLDWVESFDEVVLAFDDDDAGKEAVQKVAPLLSPGKMKVMSYHGLKDANDLLQEHGPGEVLKCVYGAAAYRPDGIINAADLWEEIISGPEVGLETPFPKLNDLLYGVREKCLYLFTAATGIGKSTLVNELAYHFLTKHEKTIGIIALEESKKRTAERFVGLQLNKPLHLTHDGVTEEELASAFKATLGSGRVWLYDHWGSTDIETLLGKIRYFAVSCGVNVLVLDHISIIVSGLEDASGNEVKTIDRLMTKLRSIIEETGITVFAVVHIRKASNEGKSFNEGKPITLDDLRGSGALGQLSDVVVSLERNQYDTERSNKCLVRVLKNRPAGTVGIADTLEYSPSTGRLMPAEDEEDRTFGPVNEEL